MTEAAETLSRFDDPSVSAGPTARVPPVVYVLSRILVLAAMEELGVIPPANDNR